MATYRHIARIAVMQTIFAYEFRGGKPQMIHDYIVREIHPKLVEMDFSHGLVKGILKEKEKIIQVIQENAPEWPVDKIARVDRAILEIGTYELLFCKDVPPVVSINESIEIAKSFGDLNSGKFINGVLSAVMSRYCPDKDSGKKADKPVKKASKTKK